MEQGTGEIWVCYLRFCFEKAELGSQMKKWGLGGSYIVKAVGEKKGGKKQVRKSSKCGLEANCGGTDKISTKILSELTKILAFNIVLHKMQSIQVYI